MHLAVAISLALSLGTAPLPPPDQDMMARATKEIHVRVVRFALITSMRVQPRVLQSRRAGAGLRHPSGSSHVLVKVDLPNTIGGLDLSPDSITINGQHVGCARQQFTYAPGARKVHLHLRRNDFLRALRGAAGATTVALQAEIDGGHMLRASDTVFVLPTAGRSANQHSNGGEHGPNHR